MLDSLSSLQLLPDQMPSCILVLHSVPKYTPVRWDRKTNYYRKYSNEKKKKSDFWPKLFHVREMMPHIFKTINDYTVMPKRCTQTYPTSSPPPSKRGYFLEVTPTPLHYLGLQIFPKVEILFCEKPKTGKQFSRFCRLKFEVGKKMISKGYKLKSLFPSIQFFLCNYRTANTTA